MSQIYWVGIDVGRHAHHAAILTPDGSLVWSHRIINTQAAIDTLIDHADGLLDDGDRLVWAVDMTAPESALLLGLLAAAHAAVRYVPGAVVHRMSGAFTGEGRTDARDAVVIAQTARLRGDLTEIATPDDLAVELELLTGHRSDLVADRTRGINRLRGLLTRIFPGLERAFDYSTRTGLAFVTAYATPTDVLNASNQDIYLHLRSHGVRRPSIPTMITAARAAAADQTVSLPGEATTAELIRRAAQTLLDLDRQISELDKQITVTFRRHRYARIVESVSGIGTILGAEFIAITGGDLPAFATPARLAAYAGLAPVSHDSGTRHGVLHRPRRYHRGLRRVFYLAALSSSQRAGPSREFYQRKRREHRTHVHALIALARRLVDVVWALIRDNREWSPEPRTSSPAQTAAA